MKSFSGDFCSSVNSLTLVFMFKSYVAFILKSKDKKMKLTKYRWGCYQAPCMWTSEATKLQSVRLRSTVRRHMAAAMAYLICSRWREFGKLTLYKTQSFKGKKFFKIYINYSFSSYYKVELNLKFKILQQCKIKEALLSLGCQKNQITVLENILATKIWYFFFQWV